MVFIIIQYLTLKGTTILYLRQYHWFHPKDQVLINY